ncbi:hypothetical protein D3C81_1784710 [compost metagenome]
MTHLIQEVIGGHNHGHFALQEQGFRIRIALGQYGWEYIFHAYQLSTGSQTIDQL